MTRFLGLGTGVGLVVANMVGAGVFLSAGFMAQELGPGAIMAAWVVGAGLALAGARAYAEVALLIPRSGGEYRYLSELFHPAIGYVAGWASLLVGFAAPMAVSAYGAAAFFVAVAGLGDARLGATTLILGLAGFHAVGLRSSRRTQNALVVAKATLVLAFVVVGLALGSPRWPSWTPSGTPESSSAAFAEGLFFVAYAFSGWNAASYVAEEFRRPRRDVPLAMVLGCALVGVAYLFVNWVLVANLTPDEAAVVFRHEEARVTLGHVVLQRLLGTTGSTLMSVGIAVMLASSTSAMLLVGPRVYAEMARDGFLPSGLRGAAGAPPRASVLLQALLAVALLHLHTVGELLSSIAGILVLFSALVALGLLFASRRRPDLRKPRLGALVAAAVYAIASAWMLHFGLRMQPTLVLWMGAAIVGALIGYALTPKPVS